jgi:hypothetical protein
MFFFGLVLLWGANTSAAVQKPAQDTTVRILIVYDSLVVESRVTAQVNFLINTWNKTDLSTTTPTTVTIANNGNPLKYSGVLSGTPAQQLQELKQFVEKAPSLRALHSADLVIGFSTTIQGDPGEILCGKAPQEFWNGIDPSFSDPDGDGLDLRGQADYYLAIVATSSLCNEDVYHAAHEMGHLFGGYHFDPPHLGLYENSRAYGKKIAVFNSNKGYVSALGSGITSVCEGVHDCLRLQKYSNPNWGDALHHNSEAINRTARSVANYVPGGGTGGGGSTPPPDPTQCSDGMDNDGDGLVDGSDPHCSGSTDDDESGPPPPAAPPGCNPAAFTPTNVTAELLQVCVPGTSRSSYRVRWLHACPGGFYQVFATQSGVGTYFVVQTASTSVDLTIQGPPNTGLVRVRACNSGFSCSSLSSPGVTLVDGC